MQLTMMHSKIHRGTVTRAELSYEGSMGVDSAFLRLTGMLPGQQVDVLNVSNGERFTTYLIAEPEGSKTIGIYGAAAHKAKAGDIVIIIAYALVDEAEARRHKGKVLIMGPDNEIVSHG